MHPILDERRRLLLYLLAWGLLGAGLALILRIWIETPWAIAALFGLPLGVAAAPMSLSSWYVCRSMPLTRTPWARIAVSAVIAALITAGMWAALGLGWVRVIAPLGLDLSSVPPAALPSLLVGFGTLGYLLSVTVHYLLQAFEESAEAGRRVLRSQIAAREAELRALRAQIDPHFLFNSLNSISGLIVPDPERARLMCQRMGDFLRDSLTLGRASSISLGREAALAEQYLRIEEVRFGRRLTARVEVAPDAVDVPVPPLLLQPLVENAVRHGIATRLDGGAVEVQARRRGDRVVVRVCNPRDPEGSRSGTGFGLDIVRRRLRAAFGDRSALSIEAAADRYEVVVTLPIEEMSDV